MMTVDAFLNALMEKATLEGLDSAEAYVSSGSSFECTATKGQIVEYSVNDTRGIGFRGMFKGKIGYAATEALDEKAIDTLIEAVKESAELSEDDSGADIFAGETDYPVVDAYNKALDLVPTEQKLDLCLEMERKTLAFDKRIDSVPDSIVQTGSSCVRLKNTFGLDASYTSNLCLVYLSPIAKDGDSVVSVDVLRCGNDFSMLTVDDLVNEAVGEALFSLHGKPVASGMYRAIIKNKAMASLLSTFSSVFSAENAQEGTSLLKGKEGEAIASEAVTLMDDPLLKNGLRSRPFDAEGVKSHTKAVIEKGTLKTLLHNRKTAKKDGVTSTGNAGKAGYSGTIRVAPTNFFFAPGEKSLDALEMDLGEGLVITELRGMHSGANPISGDFSLSAKGYTVKNGVKTAPVEQITIASNFYTLLKNMRAVGNDLVFPGSGAGSPSIDIGEISVAGI